MPQEEAARTRPDLGRCGPHPRPCRAHGSVLHGAARLVLAWNASSFWRWC